MGLNIRIRGGGSVRLAWPTFTPGGALPPGAVFARTTEAAQDNADGSVAYLAAGALRTAHYVGGVRTMLLEPTATNLASSNFSDGTWLTFSQAIDVLNESAGADGVVNARRIAGSGADAQIYRTPVLGIGDYALSYYAKSLAAGNSMRVGMYGNPNTNDYSSPAYPNAFALAVGPSWTRLKWARNAPTGLTQFGTRARGGGFTSPECRISLHQIEAGLFVSSPVRSGVARATDSLTFAQSGTLYMQWYDTTGALVDDVRAYLAGTNAAPVAGASPRAVVKIKLGLGAYSLAQMRAKP